MAEQGFETRPSDTGAHVFTTAPYYLLGLPVWLALPCPCLQLPFLSQGGGWGGKGAVGAWVGGGQQDGSQWKE